MAFSCVLVKARYNPWELVGAILMLAGAAVSVVPTLTDTDDENAKWYACLIYFCSNIPMAASCVYKESIFRKRTIDVWCVNCGQLVCGDTHSRCAFRRRRQGLACASLCFCLFVPCDLSRIGGGAVVRNAFCGGGGKTGGGGGAFNSITTLFTGARGIHNRYMANWISIYQFLISFIFVPLLVVPFIGGTETGITFPEIWTSFRDGALCWLEMLPACAGENNRGQLWLLPGFTLVNM